MASVEFRLSVALMVALLIACLLITVSNAAIPSPSVERNNVPKATRKVPTVNHSPTVPPVESPSKKPCREVCLEKHATKQSLCFQQKNCTTCQEKCATKATKATPTLDNGHHLSLVLLEMIRNESLVTADVAWISVANNGFGPGHRSSTTSSNSSSMPSRDPHQCLVTWEVSGGGLMGNLLTESTSAQLSLWPETNYRVQVTCRNKHTDILVRSAPIVLNTSDATVVPGIAMTGTTTSSNFQPSAVADDEKDAALLSRLQEVDTDPESNSVSVRAQLAVWPISRESQQEIILLGVFVALLTFLLILLTVVIFIKRKAPSASEKEELVENEALAEVLHL
ncbi:transmembrane protein fend-like [Malaya genurostris]|uniref:transmembrane protein fend-like n=1 Tax=Malaya genurostris TaxID=325434 RepID=UPI0026F3C16E|nr:transmembrane protein fend-like [Malaya genurostris]